MNAADGTQNVTILVNNMLDKGDIIIKVGDHLKCYANGNPTPRYKWTIFTELSNITVQSSDFVLSASMLFKFQFTVECKAMNEFGDKTIRFTRNVTGRHIKS